MRARRVNRMCALQASHARAMGEGGAEGWSTHPGPGQGMVNVPGPDNSLKNKAWSGWSRHSGHFWPNRYMRDTQVGHGRQNSSLLHGLEKCPDHVDHLDQLNDINGLSDHDALTMPGPDAPDALTNPRAAEALVLLRRLCLAGIQLCARGTTLAFQTRPPPFDNAIRLQISRHRALLLVLLDGSTCRWCLGPVSWHYQPGAVGLGDGTCLHAACRCNFHLDRLSALAVDQA